MHLFCKISEIANFKFRRISLKFTLFQNAEIHATSWHRFRIPKLHFTNSKLHLKN
jgi:hypothetical protein